MLFFLISVGHLFCLCLCVLERMVKEDKHAKKGDGENIKVAIRVRPLFQKEIDRGEKECVECDIAAGQGTSRVRECLVLFFLCFIGA